MTALEVMGSFRRLGVKIQGRFCKGTIGAQGHRPQLK
jgi:hypothetical protein